MKKMYIAAALLFAVCSVHAQVEKDTTKGIVTYSVGQVKKRPPDIQMWRSAPKNTEIFSGDKVRTYTRSRAELDLAELDIIRLAPETTIDIIKLYEETKENLLETKLNVEEGEIWANVHEVKMETKLDISTPVSAAAITGTVLRL